MALFKHMPGDRAYHFSYVLTDFEGTHLDSFTLYEPDEATARGAAHSHLAGTGYRDLTLETIDGVPHEQRTAGN